MQMRMHMKFSGYVLCMQMSGADKTLLTQASLRAGFPLGLYHFLTCLLYNVHHTPSSQLSFLSIPGALSLEL